MAIIKDIEVTIQVDGTNLTEYKNENEVSDDTQQQTESSQMSNYVESTSGAPFKIKFAVPLFFKMYWDCLAFDIVIDRVPARRRLCFRDHKEKAHGVWENVLDGAKSVEDGVKFLHPFLFKDIQTGKPFICCNRPEINITAVEDSAWTKPCSRARAVGMIIVKVHRMGTVQRRKNAQERALPLDSKYEFTEQELKGLDVSHRAG